MRILGYFIGLFFWLGTVNFFGIPFYWIDFLNLFLLFYLFFVKKDFKISRIIVYLSIMFVVSLIPYFYTEKLSYEGIKYFVFLIITVIVYENLTLTLSPKEIIGFLVNILTTFVTLTFFSILSIVIENGLFSISNIYSYKNFFILNFGASNYIAAILTCIGVLSIGLYLAGYEFKSELLFMSVGCFLLVIILNSRTSIICYIFGVLMNVIHTSISKNKSSKKVLFLFLIFIIVFIYVYLNTNFINLLSARFISENGNISSRFSQFSQVCNHIKQFSLFELFFGRGYGSEKLNSTLLIHNVLIKLIYSFGFLGSIIYFALLKKLFSDTESSFRIVLLTILLGSMFEPTLLTAFFDTIFFVIFIAGRNLTSLNRGYKKERINNHD